jgi:hypothetical protein
MCYGTVTDWYATSDIKTVIMCYGTVTDWYATSDIKTLIMCYGTVTDFPLFYIMHPDVYDPPHNIWSFFNPLLATYENWRSDIRTYVMFKIIL